MDPFGDLTPEEKEKLKKHRDIGFKSLRVFSWIQLGIACVFFVIGIVGAVYFTKDPHFPYIALAPIWISVLVGLGAILGILSAKHGVNQDGVATKVKCLFITNYVLSIVSITLTLMAVVWGGIGIMFCLSNDIKKKKNCSPDVTALTVLSALSILFGIILVVISIIGTTYLCRFGRSLGFKSKQERRLERRMLAMQAELNAARTTTPHVQVQGNTPPKTGEQINEGYYKW